MENKPKNPEAFPKLSEIGYPSQNGMSLRDYFAAEALNGICANSLANYGMISNNAEPDYIAKRCYQIADAMLKQREK